MPNFDAAIFKISIHALREEGDRRRCTTDVVLFISIHALREEGDVSLSHGVKLYHRFLSTPSARRATPYPLCLTDQQQNFYPRPPRGGRQARCRVLRPADKISIHALREEGDPFLCVFVIRLTYFYPRPPRGGRRSERQAEAAATSDFYPRPPRGGRRG